jgi:hypothetical protein
MNAVQVEMFREQKQAQSMTITYRMYQDHDKNYPASEKMCDAIEAYMRWSRKRPTVVMVNPYTAQEIRDTDPAYIDPDLVAGVDIREARYIGRNVFYVGREEG